MELRDDFTWSRLLEFLPSDLDSLSRRTGLVRRLRGTDSAESLLRLLLALLAPDARQPRKKEAPKPTKELRQFSLWRA